MTTNHRLVNVGLTLLIMALLTVPLGHGIWKTWAQTHSAAAIKKTVVSDRLITEALVDRFGDIVVPNMPRSGTIEFRVAQKTTSPDNLILDPSRMTIAALDSDGEFSISLWPTASLSPPSNYQCWYTDSKTHRREPLFMIAVPESSSAVTLSNCLAEITKPAAVNVISPDDSKPFYLDRSSAWQPFDKDRPVPCQDRIKLALIASEQWFLPFVQSIHGAEIYKNDDRRAMTNEESRQAHFHFESRIEYEKTKKTYEDEIRKTIKECLP